MGGAEDAGHHPGPACAGPDNHEYPLVLVNAIYFRAGWAAQFNTNATAVQPFYVSSNQTVNVSLMHQTNSVGFYQSDAFQAVELPYRGTNATMVVLLPSNPDGLAQLEASLTPQELAQVLTNMAAPTGGSVPAQV